MQVKLAESSTSTIFTMSVNKAQTLLSQLNSLNLSDPSAQRDAIIKAQSLINTLQDPGDKAMEALLSVSGPAVEK